MKKFLTVALVLGSTVAMAACTSNGYSDADLDGALLDGPYAEERTVGKTTAPAPVRSAAPVFVQKQMK
jgi:hypothetical protein